MLNETYWINQIASIAAKTDAQQADAHGFTGLFEAQIGDGAGIAAGNVLVPAGERRFPDEIKVNRLTDNRREIVRVRNLDGTIPFPERSAGYWVWCGKPPGPDTMPQIVRPSGRNGVAYGGEGTPAKAAFAQLQAEKLAGAIVPTSPPSTAVQLLGSAFINIGGQEYYPPAQTIELSDYIPATSGKACYVHIAINRTGTPVITVGEEFTYASEATPLNYVPTPENREASYKAHVYLPNGLTGITEQHIRRVPVTGYAPGASSTSSTSAAPLLASQLADVTVANTTTETSIISADVGSITIPANTLAEGATIAVKLCGYFSTTGSPTLTFKVKLGGVELLSDGISASGVTDQGVTLTAAITCRTTGAGGKVVASGQIDTENAYKGMVNKTLEDISTTADNDLEVTVTWSALSASNTITSQIFTMKLETI